MRQFLTRTAGLTAVLLVALPVAASGAVDEYAAEASTSAVEISVFEEAVGSPLLDLVNTDAFAASDPTASASVGAIEVLGEEIVPVVEANSTGEPDRDPADAADDGCVDLADTQDLTLSAVCAVAAADAGPSDAATANATTTLLDADVDGSLLAGLLTTPLGEFADVLADGATADAVTMFTQACNDFLADAVAEEAEELPGTVAELIGMLPEETEPITDPVQAVINDVSGEDDCTAIINLTLNDVVAPVIDLETIADALEGVDLVQLEVDGATSDIAGADAALTSTGTQAFVRLTGPALDFLPGAISDLLNGIEDELQAAVEDVAGMDLPEDLDISDEVQEVVDALPELGDAPLLEATVSGGRADATLDNDDATTTSGGEEPFVEVTFAPGVLELLGQDPEMGTQRFEAGESQTIAEDTPLESTISVGALTTDDDAEFEDTGLRGSTATASATTVSLLNVEGAGSVEISLARSDAGVYGSLITTAETPDDDPLPNTGGGAAVAAALALGAALVLRRRRD